MWMAAMPLLKCSILLHHLQDQALDQHLMEVAVGVDLRVKPLKIVMVMLSVGKVKSNVPEVVAVYGVHKHSFEG